jgi:hypothetical protein
MDLDQALGHVVVSTRRHLVFLCPFFNSCDQPGSLSVRRRHTKISDPTLDTFVCGLALFSYPLSPHALGARLYGHGNALISTGERIRQRARLLRRLTGELSDKRQGLRIPGKKRSVVAGLGGSRSSRREAAAQRWFATRQPQFESHCPIRYLKRPDKTICSPGGWNIP